MKTPYALWPPTVTGAADASARLSYPPAAAASAEARPPSRAVAMASTSASRASGLTRRRRAEVTDMRSPSYVTYMSFLMLDVRLFAISNTDRSYGQALIIERAPEVSTH